MHLTNPFQTSDIIQKSKNNENWFLWAEIINFLLFGIVITYEWSYLILHVNGKPTFVFIKNDYNLQYALLGHIEMESTKLMHNSWKFHSY